MALAFFDDSMKTTLHQSKDWASFPRQPFQGACGPKTERRCALAVYQTRDEYRRANCRGRIEEGGLSFDSLDISLQNKRLVRKGRYLGGKGEMGGGIGGFWDISHINQTLSGGGRTSHPVSPCRLFGFDGGF